MTHTTSKRLALILFACLAAFIVWRATHHRRATLAAASPAPTMQHEPLTMLWAWETPEDLTPLDPTKTGVAFLSREVLVDQHVQVRPRMQPLRVHNSTWLMAVVRIEAAPNFIPNSDTIAETARDIAAVAQQPNVRAVQVDFDATASQRDFYAAVLRQLRAQLPATVPLSITALVSWCGDSSWLKNLPSGALPIDEAVPMFFRMGGPAATRASHPKDTNLISESFCSGSVGIATDETWPAIHRGERVYVFRSGSWTAEDLARINAFGYQGLRGDFQR